MRKNAFFEGVRRPTGSRARAQSGWTLVSTLVLMSVVGVSLGQMVTTSLYGALAARRARDLLSLRLAADAVMNAPAPALDGGSIWPDAPLADWSEALVVEPSSGHLEPASAGTPGVRVMRQWMTATDGAGRRTMAVSVALVDEQNAVVPGPDGAHVVLSRSLR